MSKPEKATHIEEVFGEEQDEVEEEVQQMEEVEEKALDFFHQTW